MFIHARPQAREQTSLPPSGNMIFLIHAGLYRSCKF